MIKEFLTLIVDFFVKVKPKWNYIIWMTLMITSLLLFLPDNTLEILNIKNISNKYGEYLGLLFILCICLIILNICILLNNKIKNNRRFKRKLTRLAIDEKSF